MTTSADPLVVARGATVHYGTTPALDAATFTLDAGAALALVGPNGAGKSTLLRAMTGLTPLSGGELWIDGRSPVDARDVVAYVPQADVLDREFPVSVRQVVAMGRVRGSRWWRRAGRDDRVATDHALERVAMSELAERRFGALSGGQRQRVLLARAIARSARLYILDEPFNGLDASSADVLVALISELRADGAAVVMATHDLAIAHLTCDDACLLNGHQVAWGPVEVTLTRERLADAYGAGITELAGAMTITRG